MKNTGIGKNLFKKKRGLETCEVKEVHRGKKDCRKKEKESLKPTKHEKAARMGQESAGRKKEKWLKPTENREEKTQASYHQYFIYLHYHVFKHLHSIYTEQTGTAFYAKEEGRQEKQRNKKLISTWKNIRMEKACLNICRRRPECQQMKENVLRIMHLPVNQLNTKRETPS